MSGAARPPADLAQRVDRLGRQQLTTKALREQVVQQLRRTMPFDAYNFPLTDPASRVATSPLADVPMLSWAQLPDLIRWRYLTTIGRWDTLIAAHRPATSLLIETAAQPERSALWQHVQRSLGVVDTAIVVFSDRYGCWGVLDLWRTNAGPFTAAELRTLSALAEPVAVGLRRAIARTFVDPYEQQAPLGPAVILLDPDMRVRTHTDAAATTLLELNPPDEPMAPIPAAAYNIAAALVAAENGVAIGPATSRIHLGGRSWVTVKASRLIEDIAVSIEPSTPAERMDLYARASGLSERESEILGLLGQGLDTREIARRLVISDHTAADHIKTVLNKTGARTRQILLARGLGAAG